jgi:hypothetical protein
MLHTLKLNRYNYLIKKKQEFTDGFLPNLHYFVSPSVQYSLNLELICAQSQQILNLIEFALDLNQNLTRSFLTMPSGG